MNRPEILAAKFQAFLENLKVDNVEHLQEVFRGVARGINQEYWKIKSDTRNAYFIGSYGRGTAIKGVSNVNMLVILPQKLYEHFNARRDNGQMALIQNVSESVGLQYEKTWINEEGHILIALPIQVTFEVVPSFLNEKKSYIYPEPAEGGIWKRFNPLREIQVVEEQNYLYNGKIKHLARMMRAWKNTHEVPLSGILLDTLVLYFMEEWEGNQTSFSYYGNMVQDFLEYLAGRRKEQLHWYAKGSNRQLLSPDDFGEKANLAYKNVRQAMALEMEGDSYSASKIWKKVFGNLFPI